jgi:hypothetical protein
MQTSALIFLSSAGIDGSFDVADQSDTPSSEIGELCDTDRTARRREGSRFLLTSNYYQLQSTMIAQWARVRHVTVRILIRLFPKVAFATASLPYFQFCQTMPGTLLTELLTFRLSPCRNLKFA